MTALVLAAALLGGTTAAGDEEWTWRAGRDLPVEGVGYADGETPFVRWPARAKGKLPSGLWSMGRQSTGVYLRFKTDADRLAVRWRVENEHPTDPLIPEAGLSGLDVYRQENGGRWRFVGNKRYWSRDHGTNAAGRAEFAWTPGAAGIVYLPTRSHVVDLRVGVPKGRSFAAFPHPAGHEKPIVHYGTSIVHGGCASRPGLTFTAIAGRALDRNYINLGFSGAAKMEIELPPYLAEIDAAAYVVDPVWNMDVKMIEERAAPFLRKLRDLRPATPILLCEGCTQSATPMRTNVAMRKVYDALKAEDPAKWANLHYFGAEGMFPPDDDELTHDFCHPNDWGSKFMGPAYAKRIQEVLDAHAAAHVAKVVVLPDAPTAVERSAAAELAEGLGRVLGETVETVTEKDAEDAAKRTRKKVGMFFVGATRASRAARGDAKWKTDGVFLKSVPGGVVLDGEPTRAPLYAVDLYLEKCCGVRWWTSSSSTYPRLDAVPLDGVSLDYAPPFAYRETYYLDGFDPKFKVRSKGNFSSLTRYMLTDMSFIPPELGGNHRLYFFTGRRSAYHSFFEVLPPATHFKAHPEWYSLVKGKRTPKQLCLANAEMKKAYIAETLRRLREDSSVDFIQVSQNDWYGSCECDACKALEAEDGGVPSGPYLRFANEVAEAVEKEFPKVRVDTFAYQFTRRAPAKTRPRHNVVVRLCDIECDFSTPLAEGRQKANAAFVKDLADWSKVAAGRLFIWDYLADFHSYMMPHPNISSIAPNIRLFAANGATGVYEQGDALCAAGTFAPLRHYLTSHLLWNPGDDARRLIQDFLSGYYGKSAAPHLAQAIDRIETAAHAKQSFVGCGHAKAPFLTADEALDADAHFAAALEAAKKDGANYAARVRREALSMDHLFLLEWDAYKTRAAERKLPWRRCRTRAGAVERWISACEDFGVLTHRETTTRKTYFDYLANLRKEAGCRAWELGETYQRTRLPGDRRAWHVALEAEEHDFSHRARTPTDARGVYKLNHDSKLACLRLRKTEKAGDSWDEDLGTDGRLHVEWTRKPNGAIDYRYTAPTNWDVFVTAYPGAVTRWGVKVMKARTGTNDPMPSVTLPEGWRVVKGEEYSGVNVREAYLAFEKDGLGLPPPQVALAWPGVGVRAVYGASNVVVAAEGATFVPSARKPPTSFGTGLPKKGAISCSITHHVKGMQAGPHRSVPYPENEIRAARNFVFAMRDALGRLGFDKEGAIEHGGLWLGGFDSNFPNGHTDFPAHFHICVPCRDGNQVHHFYMRPEDGRITWDCHQDMSNVMDIWDRVFRYVPGDAIPVYDGCGRVAFTAQMLADGTGFEFTRPGRSGAVRACGTRPCDAVEVLEKEGDGWRKVACFAIADDPVKGEMTTPEGVIRYDPDTGARRE